MNLFSPLSSDEWYSGNPLAFISSVWDYSFGRKNCSQHFFNGKWLSSSVNLPKAIFKVQSFRFSEGLGVDFEDILFLLLSLHTNSLTHVCWCCCRCGLMQELERILLMVLCALGDGKSWSNITRACKLKTLHRKQLFHPHRDSVFCSYIEISTSEFLLEVEHGHDNRVFLAHVQHLQHLVEWNLVRAILVVSCMLLFF